jgi:hypothetical protein
VTPRLPVIREGDRDDPRADGGAGLTLRSAAEEILDPDAFAILGHVLRATGGKPEMIS